MTSRRGLLLIAVLFVAAPQFIPAQTTKTIGQKMASFLESQKGKRLGGGECAHVASEALRVTGGEFIRNDIGSDDPGKDDYVWGTLVTVVEFKNGRLTDLKPTNKAQPGDILQYRNVTVRTGKGINLFKHHTAVVAAVGSSGRPTQIYQQNVTFNGTNSRKVQKDDINLAYMTDGWVRIYRPKTRADKEGQYKFGLVNHTSGVVKYSVKSGTFEIKSATIDADNTAGSYITGWYNVKGTNKPVISLPVGSSIPIENSAGYEVYQASKGGSLGIRKLQY